ncbi:hypothetical protein CDL12_24515 [Handroanthus impetiginosus]|uniref:non-specific serine/threonine protein kinase n=1 Tax=Handroanthus impetiginosus TaxID=429701 RepID=A0A2G9GCF0_9LAMI|nr:hypothetical protein CDL12_24515 [Handroanthus impetiginosus]
MKINLLQVVGFQSSIPSPVGNLSPSETISKSGSCSENLDALFSFSNILADLSIFFLSRKRIANNSQEFYHTCGNTITRIECPFRGSNDPPFRGYPSIVLTCDERNNVSTIDIMNMTYRVIEIDQAMQIMRIVREDVMEGTCPKELVNTNLDHPIFDYASSYMNFTFLYGCPGLNIPGLSLVSCGNAGYDGVYMFPGTKSPGNCNAGVVIPVLVSRNGSGRPTKWYRIGSSSSPGVSDYLEDCNDCTESRGWCGYSFETNRTTCFCPDPPYVSDTCLITSGASPAKRSAM